TGVREEIEHAPSRRDRTRQRTILPLIEEESRLLSRRRLHDELQAVLADGGLALPFTTPFRLERQAFDLPRRKIVLEVDAARLQLFAQYIGDEWAQALQPMIRNLDDEQIVVAIDHQSAEVVALGVNEPRRVRVVREDRSPPRDRRRDACPQQLRRQLFVAERQRAHPDLRVR